MTPLEPLITWVPFESLGRLTLALGVGLFVGLEREWRKKEAGLRTFGLLALLGGMGGLLGSPYSLMTLASSGLLVVLLNVHSMRAGEGTELTTSAALLVTSLSGVLCGLGHTITPVAVGVVTAGLLSWKESLATFGQQLTAAELRSAILLAILAFAIYPVLPELPEILLIDTHASFLPDNDNWHTDVTFSQTPPLAGILAAKRLPSVGGDTLWSSSSAAYEALSEPMRRMLEGLTATHSIAKSFPPERWQKDAAFKERYERAVAKHPPVSHPVVRTHPVSGRKGLFVNEGFTTHINELAPRESEALLGFLFKHAAQPEFTVRWRWSVDDVAFWDNRVTQHYAIADYLPERRTMHRATVNGDRPY